MTARAIGWPFAHVTADSQDRKGMGRDPWGDGCSVCKTAGIASSSTRATRPCSLPACRRGLLDLASRVGATAARSLAPGAVHGLGVTVVFDHAAIGAVLRRLTAGLTAQLTAALASVRLDPSACGQSKGT